MGSSYPYATGDLIERPNTYFYTPFEGKLFVEEWRRTRQEILEQLPPPTDPPPAFEADGRSRKSVELLERAFAGDNALREAFRRKFEITKRVHGGYDREFRALDREDRHSLERYIRAADVFERTYSEQGSLRYLNVLHKSLDTLCAFSDQLDPPLGSRLAWHLNRERLHFDEFSAAVS